MPRKFLTSVGHANGGQFPGFAPSEPLCSSWKLPQTASWSKRDEECSLAATYFHACQASLGAPMGEISGRFSIRERGYHTGEWVRAFLVPRPGCHKIYHANSRFSTHRPCSLLVALKLASILSLQICSGHDLDLRLHQNLSNYKMDGNSCVD